MRHLLVVLAVGTIGCSRPLPAEPSAPKAATMNEQHPIVQAGSPGLRARSSEVPQEKLGTKELDDLVAKMIATMRAAPGVGLAAPQIGVPWRVIVLEDREELLGKLTPEERRERERVAFPTRVFVNPTVKMIGDEKAMFFEGCLSVKGWAALVERNVEVEVEGLDPKGTPQKWRVRGWPARILQHEVDHLDGTLYVDRMYSRSFSTLEHAKELYGGKPIVEIRRMLGL